MPTQTALERVRFFFYHFGYIIMYDGSFYQPAGDLNLPEIKLENDFKKVCFGG